MLGQHDFSGDVLGGRYHLDRRIGCGAMATIYAATDQTTNGCVASISASAAEYVVPDVIVSKRNGRWLVELN